MLRPTRRTYPKTTAVFGALLVALLAVTAVAVTGAGASSGNPEVTRQRGGQAEVFAYIQANHFLPDNSVDIAGNDYTIQAVKERGRWKVTNKVIVGTALLNFSGAPVPT